MILRTRVNKKSDQYSEDILWFEYIDPTIDLNGLPLIIGKGFGYEKMIGRFVCFSFGKTFLSKTYFRNRKVRFNYFIKYCEMTFNGKVFANENLSYY